jgi:tRNA G18 (ribose-2'-O)-methylase SpoU
MHLNNLGTNIRTLECFGIPSCYVFDEFKLIDSAQSWTKEKKRKFNNFSAGASSIVKISCIDNPREFLNQWKGRKIATIATHSDSVSLFNFRFIKSDLIIIGSESAGLDQLTLNLCDTFMSIPQFGKTNSLNISCATAIFTYEWSKQLQEKTA